MSGLSAIASEKTTDRGDPAVQLERETVAAYGPIVRIFLLLLAFYYAVVTVNHFTSETGLQLAIMVVLSVASSVIALLCRRWMTGGSSLRHLEWAGLIGNGLLLINLNYFYTTQFDPNRLVYFVLMVVVFAMTGATRRVALASSAAAFASLFAIIAAYDPSMLQVYIYISLASGFAAVGGSLLMRRVITDALAAKLEAAQRRREAVDAAAYATQLSITDNLTGLPNRRDFFEKLDQYAERCDAEGLCLAVLLVDLDAFKPVNDTYGHSVGDRLLVAAAERLRTGLPEQTYLARIGGDEFAVIAMVASPDKAETIGQSLCRRMTAAFNLGRVMVHIGATVGLATRDDRSTPPTALVENADYALYSAKRESKGTCAVFTHDDARVVRKLFAIDQALRSGNLEHELEVVYQPQYDITAAQVIGFEALARWHSKDLGMVEPTDFIAVAESSGLITDATLILLRKALGAASTWPTHLTLSFNLSVHDVLDVTAIENIVGVTQRSGIDPSRICFEITETVMMGDTEKAGVALQKLVDAGHKIALDDFGTGYSNFGYLHQLPIDKIKIDRSFLRDSSGLGQSARIVATLLHLTRSLNKDCIIEGVETETEFAAVQSLGANMVQGYYFGKPMQADEALKLVDQSESNGDETDLVSVG